MKIPLTALLVTFAFCAFAQATVGTPLSGTPVGLEGDPGSFRASAETDQKGKFSFVLPAGKYKLAIPYARILKTLNAGTDTSGIILVLGGLTSGGAIFDRWGNLVKTQETIVLTAKTSTVGIVVPKGGGTLTGTLTSTKTAAPKAAK